MFVNRENKRLFVSRRLKDIPASTLGPDDTASHMAKKERKKRSRESTRIKSSRVNARTFGPQTIPRAQCRSGGQGLFHEPDEVVSLRNRRKFRAGEHLLWGFGSGFNHYGSHSGGLTCSAASSVMALWFPHVAVQSRPHHSSHLVILSPIAE